MGDKAVRPGQPQDGFPGGVDIGRRLRWESDARGRLLVLDSSDDTLDEAYAAFYALKRAVSAEAPDSVRVLMLYENHSRDPALSRLWRDAGAQLSVPIFRTAIVGIGNAMVSVVAAYRMSAKMQGRDIESKLQVFKDEDAARAWLLAC